MFVKNSFTLIFAFHFKDHNCVRELRTLVLEQNRKIAEMQTEIAEHKLQISEQKRELQLLKVAFAHFTIFTFLLQYLTDETGILVDEKQLPVM